MRGIPVEKLPHSCGTRKGLQVFEQEDGSYDGYCYSCSEVVPDPYQNKPEGYKPQVVRKTAEDVQAELKELMKLKPADIPDRKLRADTCKAYGVRVGYDESNAEDIAFHYYPYTADRQLKGVKTRMCAQKRMWSVGDVRTVDLFGWETAVKTGAPRLYITEGELDALSLYQILLDKNKGTAYADNKPAVVSLPHGVSSAAKDLARLHPKISKHFKEIVLVFDGDEPGKAAVEAVMKVVPECLVATLPAKDANECLVKGMSKACANAVLFKAEKPKNTRIVWGEELHEAAKEPAQFGVSWPWAGITDMTRGIRLGETIYIGAAQKMG